MSYIGHINQLDGHLQTQCGIDINPPELAAGRLSGSAKSGKSPVIVRSSRFVSPNQTPKVTPIIKKTFHQNAYVSKIGACSI